jgi:hypothetical protein
VVSEVDRHFLRAHDDRIVDFAKGLEWRSSVGFHVALDDPLMRLFIGPEIVEMLGGV